jgi:hypothetical protein
VGKVNGQQLRRTMEKYFTSAKRQKTLSWVLSKAPAAAPLDPPLSPQPDAPELDQSDEDSEEYVLLFLVFLEDQAHGEPQEWARLVAVWQNGLRTTVSVSDMAASSDPRILRMLARCVQRLRHRFVC